MTSRLSPWNNLGIAASKSDSVSDLLERAGLNWKVSLEEIHADTISGLLKIEDKFATVKTTTDEEQSVISVVGSRYNVFQNEEIFEPFNSLVSSQELLLSAAGELKGGALVWMMMQLPESIKIVGDEHSKYLLARTSHDGTIAFQVVPIVSRLRCTNQISAAFSGDQSRVYSLKHTLNNKINVDEIYSVIKLVNRDFTNYASMANKLIDIRLTDNEFGNYVNQIYALPSKIENAPYNMLSSGERRTLTVVTAKRQAAWLVWTGDTMTQENLHGTKYGAFQAIVEVEDHHGKKDKSDFKMLTSKDSTVKSKALELLNV
jgi:phage/plasmid-like protein (TIGR03299 family)